MDSRKQRKYTHHHINGEQDRGVEEEKWEGGREGGKERESERAREGGKGGSNGVFVQAGETHKAFAGAAQLSYRYQTQRIRRAECMSVYMCEHV